jgi:hypothetical protein
MTEAFKCCKQDVRTVREDVDGIAQRVESTAERQIDVCQQGVLPARRSAGLRCFTSDQLWGSGIHDCKHGEIVGLIPDFTIASNRILNVSRLYADCHFSQASGVNKLVTIS